MMALKRCIFILVVSSAACLARSDMELVPNANSPTCAAASLSCGQHGACSDATGVATCVCDSGYVPPNCVPLPTLVVEPLYPVNGANWNDYVINDGPDSLNASDSACTTAQTGYAGCIHGGERRRVATPLTSCAGVSASDALGVFNWICRTVNGSAVYCAKGFLVGKGLRDLVDAGGWKANNVALSAGAQIVGVSVSAVWWSNPVVALPQNPGNNDPLIVLDNIDDDGAGPDFAIAPGTILTAAASTTTSGYQFNEDKLALVALPGVTLTYSGNPAENCLDRYGDVSRRCVLSFVNQSFVWIEGSFDGRDGSGGAFPTDEGLFAECPSTTDAVAGCFARIHNATFVDNAGAGIEAALSSSTFDGVITANNGDDGFDVDDLEGGDILISGLSSFNNSGDGFYAANPHPLLLTGARLANNGGYGLDSNTSDNSYVGIVSFNNGGDNVYLDSGGGPTANVTLVNAVVFAGGTGNVNISSAQATVLAVTTVNDGMGVYCLQDHVTFAQVVAANDSQDDFSYSGWDLGANLVVASGTVTPGNNSRFLGSLLVHSGAQCDATGITNSGLATGTCANLNGSSAALVDGIDLTNTFVGKVTVADPVNTSDFDGTAYGQNAYAAIADWVSFETPFRGWGLDGSTFPDVGQQGRCKTGTCRVWDWRLRVSDTMIRNKSGNGSTENEPFVAGQPCPSAVDGNDTLDDQQSFDYRPGVKAIQAGGTGPCGPGQQCFNRFLVNAIEVIGDEIGDDDGLCESNEACIYAPNFGAYQGEGNYTSGGTCVFSDGKVYGVTMYAYPVNGQ